MADAAMPRPVEQELELGEVVPDEVQARQPEPCVLAGVYCDLRPIDPVRDCDSLFALTSAPGFEARWAYMFDAPFHDREVFEKYLEELAQGSGGRVFWAIAEKGPGGGRAVGWLSLMRIEVAHRCVEVGNVMYTGALQRTRAGTEAQFLLARHVFEDLHFRRYEWKCHNLNGPSKKAAQRFGFAFEGVFRQHLIIKGRSRDTCWFSMLDSEWPVRKLAFEQWLAAANFTDSGLQRRALADMRAELESLQVSSERV